MLILKIRQNMHFTDIFEHLIENSDFYASIQDFHRKVEYFENVVRFSPPTKERIETQLALLSLKIQRVGTDLDTKSALDELDEIAKYASSDSLLEIKYRIVRAQYHLLIEEDFLSAKEIFDKLLVRLRESEHHILYALVSKVLCVVNMMLGDTPRAEELAQDAIATFRRFGSKLLYAYCLNNYGVLKKKVCQYSECEELLKKSLKIFLGCGASDGEALCYGNLGIVKMKLGDWAAAAYYCEKAIELGRDIHANEINALKQKLNLEHLYLLKRDFKRAEAELKGLLRIFSENNILKQKALTLEFLGELYIEIGEYHKALRHLEHGADVASQSAPESDVMTEIKRRKAQLCFNQGQIARARIEALQCVHLSKAIGDKHELGASLRILGETYVALDNPGKAVSAFEASIHTLKSIHECYELMKSCISYSEYLLKSRSNEAEVYLLEAKQICKKLELDYFMSRILLLMGQYAMNNRNYTEARAYLRKAEAICEKLQECDRRKITPGIREFYKSLESAILKASMDSAQKLKALGKIYEEARFPIEEVRPELAMEVVRNVEAESLFLVLRKTKGYGIPLTYNISINEAKKITRILNLKTSGKLFGKDKDPRIHLIGDDRAVICVPGQSEAGYILCTVVHGRKDFTPSQLEFLFASVEVMECLAQEYTPRHLVAEASEFIDEDARTISHPGGNFKNIITVDPEMIKIIRLAERASKTDAPILLEGETGVGKELFARAIHESSPRRNEDFVALNAGGVPVNFLESQLFGHVKGAFTDARMDRVGLIEEAAGGSIFFDEIGEMHEELQVKLLRILENGEFRRLGENKLRFANVRIISATNKTLEELVNQGVFRKDLYYRLATVRLQIPPLRYRKRDIELLVRQFLRETLARIAQSDRHIDIDLKAIQAFEIYDWPGNVRELQNEIMRIISLIGEGEIIRFGMLSDAIKNYFRKHSDEGLLEKSMERFERRLILKALEENDWNRIKTAEKIGIPRTTLIGKMKRLNIISP